MNHPAITHIGKVIDDGVELTVTQWGIGLCAGRCDCHLGPNGQPAIAPSVTGSLGLVQYRVCSCCTAWTVDELEAIVVDLAGMQVA